MVVYRVGGYGLLSISHHILGCRVKSRLGNGNNPEPPLCILLGDYGSAYFSSVDSHTEATECKH